MPSLRRKQDYECEIVIVPDRSLEGAYASEEPNDAEASLALLESASVCGYRS